jgi:hypothetical protein
MGFCTLHFQKSTEPIRGDLGNHIDRVPGREYSYRHADLSLTEENMSLPDEYNKYVSMPYNDAIKARVQDGYKGKKALRKDAIWSVNTMLTGSHEEMKKIGDNPNLLQDWITSNLEWCEQQFGRDNIVRFTVHLDEKTPHIHCVWCPITEDGRLSAQEWIGNSKKLEALQSSYAEKMKPFGLERGISSDKKHVDTEEWRRERANSLKSGEELSQKIDNISKTNLLFGLEGIKKDLKAGVNTLMEHQQQQFNIEKQKLIDQNKALTEEIKQKNINQAARTTSLNRYIPNVQTEEIINDSNVIDYFLHLADRGDIVFQKKSGKEFLFNDNAGTQKLSVSEKGWRDFKSSEGGQIVKAVMKYEHLSWLEAINWLKEFNQDKGKQYAEIREKTIEETPLREGERKVTMIIKPNNKNLARYFFKRGISFETLMGWTKQVHFQDGDKHIYGIGVPNSSGGWDIRNEGLKTKVGNSDITLQANNWEAQKIVVCEGFVDMLSMVEIAKAKGKIKDYIFCSLNSVSNLSKFVQYAKRLSSVKIISILDGDEAGQKATEELMNALPGRVEDQRDYFNIGAGEKQNKDLNSALVEMQLRSIKEEQEQSKSRGRKIK